MFSIIQRNRHHRSNIYSGAPMPYMQRLTWSGIALHQGVLPGRPASHGCIRLPESFANFLWNTTKMNTRVIVARDDVEPQDIVHAKLFQPKAVPTTVESPMPDLRKTFDTTHPGFVRTAGMQMVITDAASGRRRERREQVARHRRRQADENAARIKADNAQPMLQSADEKPAIVEVKPAEPQAPASEPAKQEIAAPAIRTAARGEAGSRGSATGAAEPAKPELAGSEPAKPESERTTSPRPCFRSRPISPTRFLRASSGRSPRKPSASGPTGPVSVFISRKDKRLYVRQAFIPLFTANVKFKDENAPFGTHVFTAYEKEDGKSLRWTAVTLPAEAAVAETVKPTFRIDARGRRVEVPAKPSKPVEAIRGRSERGERARPHRDPGGCGRAHLLLREPRFFADRRRSRHRPRDRALYRLHRRHEEIEPGCHCRAPLPALVVGHHRQHRLAVRDRRSARSSPSCRPEFASPRI